MLRRRAIAGAARRGRAAGAALRAAPWRCSSRRRGLADGTNFQAFPMGLYEQPPAGGTADPVRVFAGDGPRSLTAAQIRGTTRLLRPEAVRYSPALGLLMFNAMPFVSNLRWSAPLQAAAGGTAEGAAAWALGNACALAEELFFQRERSQPLALTRSRSRVAYYLTPALLGHVLGLASASPALSDKELDAALRSLGIQTNKVHGEKTGVSLARWRRVIRLAAAGGGDSNSNEVGEQLATAMFLRVLWERARTKACLVTFLLTLDTYIPVLRPAGECPIVVHFRIENEDSSLVLL